MKAAPILLGCVFSAFFAVAGSSGALAQITIAHNGASTLTVYNLQFSIGTCTFRESTGANHICGAADLLYLKTGTGAGAGIDIVRRNGSGVEVPIFSATGGATGTWDLAVQINVKVLGVSETVTAAAAGIYGSVTGGVASDLTKVTGGETFALASGTAPNLVVNLAAPSATSAFSAAQTYNQTFSVTKDFGLVGVDTATAGSTLVLTHITQNFTPAPEPAAIGAFIVGLLGLRAARRRKKVASV